MIENEPLPHEANKGYDNEVDETQASWQNFDGRST
jgi:hypothetical protein